ncbi:c-type cytochrome [Pseudochryseolinea flava]|uniref:Cytochrome c n=1 Tax=Pseudochryseolinea flava TaxID=2059302 RepID=A0A364Y0S4_9BACT|nr:cytochrome c [Pseudochryseolinea flava]RAV99348.1 cytochrome c [Pseudochryseolinea flava]
MNRNITLIIGMLAGVSITLLSFDQKFDLKASITRGKEVYTTQCMTCHMEQGEGIEGAFPPLAKSDYLMADKKRSITQILHGLSGEIKVNGVTYNGEMAAIELTDQELSDVLNYVRNSWGNKGEAVTPAEVKALRK